MIVEVEVALVVVVIEVADWRRRRRRGASGGTLGQSRGRCFTGTESIPPSWGRGPASNPPPTHERLLSSPKSPPPSPTPVQSPSKHVASTPSSYYCSAIFFHYSPLFIPVFFSCFYYFPLHTSIFTASRLPPPPRFHYSPLSFPSFLFT